MQIFCESNYIGIPTFRSVKEDDIGLKPVHRYIDMPRPLHRLYELAFWQVPSSWTTKRSSSKAFTAYWNPKLIFSKALGEYGMLLQWTGGDDAFRPYLDLFMIKDKFPSVRFGPSKFFADREVFIPDSTGKTELARFLTALNRAEAGEFGSPDSYAGGVLGRMTTTLTPTEVHDWLAEAKRLHVRRPYGAGIRESMLTKGVFHVAFHHAGAPSVQWDGWFYHQLEGPAKDYFVASIGKQGLEDYYDGDLMKFARNLKTTLGELLIRDIDEDYHPNKDAEDDDSKISIWRTYVQKALYVHASRLWKPVSIKSSEDDSKEAILPVSPAFIIEV